MNDHEFRMLLNLYMISDPWPLTPEEDDTCAVLLNTEAKKRGFSGWVPAYHKFKPED